jgi:cysteine-rich repeat protein
MMVRIAVVVAIVGSGCVSSDSYVCSDGTVCPEKTVCAPIPHATNAPSGELCVDPDAIAACTNKADNATCDGGVCHDGVCLPIACGNGFVDPGEQCDDHNQVSGDGCNADCTSTETCGNSVRDGLQLEECDDGNLVSGDGCDSNCLLEGAVWKQVAMGAGTPRRAQMAYDIAHDQMVVFGGKTTGTFPLVLADTTVFAGRAWKQATARTVPIARYRAALAYDAVHQRVVMFGGADASGLHVFDETWLWDGHDWQQARPATTPAAREGAMMAFDGKRGRIIMFGGRVRNVEGGSNFYEETWSWDGTNWTLLQPTTIPEGRTGAGMSYDPLRDQVVMFGGTNKLDAVNTNTTSCTFLSLCAIALKTWTFDGSDWHAYAGTQPSTRFDTRMAWDASTHTTLLFGGNTSTTAGTPADLQDTWLWTGSAWTTLTPAVKPAARSDYSLASNPATGRITLAGGTATDGKTWQWNGSVWTDVTPVLPTPGRESQSAYDLRRGRNVAIDTMNANQTYELDRSGWIARGPGPTDVFNETPMAYDVAHARTVLFGGTNLGLPLASTWLWDGTSWSKATPPTSPSPRSGAALAYDPSHKRVVLFGGEDDTMGLALADTWEWDGTTWSQMATTTAPDAREEHGAAFDSIASNVVLFGGTNDSAMPNQTPVWDGNAWAVVAPAANTASPPGRVYPNMLWVPRRRAIVMFSGLAGAAGDATQSDTWEWHDGTWTPIAATGTPPSSRGEAFPMLTGDGSLQLYSGGTSGVFTNLTDSWSLVWENASPQESCVIPADLDGDGLAGCADPDCWMVCNPTCSPGVACDASAPHCGDGTCDGVETCRMCPEDCGACPAMCGDSFCDPGETAASCPGDCH